MKMSRFATLTLALILLASPSFAADEATKDDAMSLSQKAADMARADGVEKTLSVINSQAAPFNDPLRYVTVTTQEGKSIGNSGNPKMVGKDMIDITDVDGKPFIKEMIALSKEKGKFSQEYKFTDPVSKKIRPKEVFCDTVEKVIFCSGYYK